MSFAHPHQERCVNGASGSLGELVDRKPNLAAILQQTGGRSRPSVCQSSTPCPYDITLREMLQAAVDRASECPCTWVRKRSSFTAELNSMMEVLMGRKAPLTSSFLNFLRGMLLGCISQVEDINTGVRVVKENGVPDEIVLSDEDIGPTVDPPSDEKRKKIIKQEISGSQNETTSLSYRKSNRPAKQESPLPNDAPRKRSRSDDVHCETPPVSPPVQNDDVVEVTLSAEDESPSREKKKRRKVRRAPWDKRRKREVALVPSSHETDELETPSSVDVVVNAKKRIKEETQVMVNGSGRKSVVSSQKRAIVNDRVLRSKPSETSDPPSVDRMGNGEFRGFQSDDAESATYYYVLFKNFLKSNLCDVTLRLC